MSSPPEAPLTDLESGAQPLVKDDGSIALAVNGEIYNHRILRKQLKIPYNYKTNSDCEVIIPLVGWDRLPLSTKLTRSVFAIWLRRS
jgi:asparagine synthetase B (glutamine-hydrolysing)